MFNIYEFDKRNQKEAHETLIQKRERRYTTQLKQRNSSFSRRYKDRIGQFIKKMLVDPVKEEDPYDIERKVTQMKNYDGNRSFRYTSNQRERVFEEQKKYSFIDTTPSQICNGKSPESIMNLRPREKEKELAYPSFRHQPRDRIERVYDALLQRNLSNIPDMEILEKKTQRKILKSNFSLINRDESNNSYQNSSRLGQQLVKPIDICKKLHNKTHFKAATSVFLGHKGVLQDKDKSIEKTLNDFTVKRQLKILLKKDSELKDKFNDLKNKQIGGSKEMEYGNMTQNSLMNQTFGSMSPSQIDIDTTISPNLVAKQVLLNCRVMRRRNINVNPISRNMGNQIQYFKTENDKSTSFQQ